MQISTEDALEQYQRVRAHSERITSPLTPEDCVIQSMPDVSPTRWHLAHTTWFFETFVLKEGDGYQPFDEQYEYLFNSYYNTVGEQFPRSERGLLSRPALAEVWSYRQHVDAAIRERIASGAFDDRAASILEIGLHHEQQHQELMLTDIKHVLSRNPLHPIYDGDWRPAKERAEPLQFVEFAGGLTEVGHDGAEFAYDNESPRHQVFLRPFALGSRAVTNGEYRCFIEDGGYQQPEWWLSLGWAHVSARNAQAPLYWTQRDGDWCEFTLSGLQTLDESAPACHLNYFEADAFARWSGARLPTEMEWEVASREAPRSSVFADELMNDGAAVHPRAAAAEPGLQQMIGDVWEWTASAYAAYPGYCPPPGALGEYNGKFMCGQFVLRGGSAATPSDHIRPTYRNFFPPEASWQFSGLRLAKDLD